MAAAGLKIKSEKTSDVKEILKVIKTFSINDKLMLERELEKDTLLYRAKQLSKSIKPNKIKLSEIVSEVKSVRKNKK